ncbi:MAG: polysaccharide biosynthesis tyrosine autokinase [Actinomycetota bacterium]|nr:polysaccharide biosynthesis tyrosine autokinase [Actinomycetota bacterium]
MVGVAAITASLPNVYATNSYVLVGSDSNASSDYEATQTNQVLLKTYAELLQTPSVATRVAESLPFKMSSAEVQKSVQIAPISQSQLIELSAESLTPQRAQTLVNTYARIFVERSGDSGWGAGDTVRTSVAESAALPSAPIRPRPKLYLLVGAVLAALLAAAVAMVREWFDQRIEINSSTTELLGLPIIARIPEQSTSLFRNLLGDERRRWESPALMDAFRGLLANLTFMGQEQGSRSLAVLSVNEGEGKSTCCVSIGQAALDQGMSVVLVDGDLRRPRLASMLRVPEQADSGFSSFLAGTAVVAMNKIALEVPGSSLRVIPSGQPPPNPAALLAQRGLTDFERRAKQLFDLVIYDSPPLGVAADATLLAAAAESAILVVDARRARRAPLLQATEQLRRAGADVVGVVLNHVTDSQHRYYRSYERPDAPRRRRLPWGGPDDMSERRARKPLAGHTIATYSNEGARARSGAEGRLDL